jgi:PAS domain S-box-containing protein
LTGVFPESAEERIRPGIIIGVFAITAAVVVASTLLTFWFGNRVLQAHAREEQRREIISQLDLLVSTLKDAETGQRGFVITGDERYLEPYNDAVARLPLYLEKLNSLQQAGGNQSEVEAITRLIQQKLAEIRETIELRRSAGLEAAAAVVRNNTGRDLMDEVRAGLSRLRSQQIAAWQSDANLSDETTRRRTAVFVLTGLLNILFLWWAYQRITETVKQRDSALGQAHSRGRELQEQKDLLAVTLASIGDCVMVADNDGRINFMNGVAEQVTGWTLQEARGRPTAEVFHILNEQTREPVENPVERVLKHGVIVGLANHTLLVRKDGTEIPIDDSGAPIRGPDGGMRGVVLVFRDFSEHRKVDRELRKAKEEAETASKAKDQFLAMLSHELRTPLTPVLATLNLWEASEDVPAALHPDVQMLRRSIELEARIIDDLLDLTRIARGMLSFSAENTDVHALIEFLVGLSRSEFQEKQLNVSLNLEAREHNIQTDVARLQQVLWNIVRNAIKFTETGGAVTIATSNNDPGHIDIVVKDTGIGMTAETLSRLFLPFEQAERSRSGRYGGLGLGMAISSALVELLEGKLTAESEGLGHGSTFTVTFPTTQKAAEPSEPESIPTINRAKIKLLLIEDHADTARALVRLLGNRGYNITSLATVASALEVIAREQFDLLLCDLGLPDATGFDFIEKVRQTRTTPAVALTGFGMQQDVERALQAGFDAHLTKPVNLQKLEAAILKLLQNRPKPLVNSDPAAGPN